MTIISQKTKSRYDRRARCVEFQEGQKDWFFNSRRIKEKTPKLQTRREGSYEIIKKINDLVFCIRKSARHKKKIVHADRLVSFVEREVPNFSAHGF